MLNPGMSEVVRQHSVHGLSASDILLSVIGLIIVTFGYQLSKRGQRRNPADTRVDVQQPRQKEEDGYVPKVAVLLLLIVFLILTLILL